MKFTVLLGRILFSLIFISSSVGHFSSRSIEYAGSQGVPMASVLVPISGVIALVGGLSILLGLKARFGAWMIILFLIPVTFMMHDFWTITDAMQRETQMHMFMKNLAMLGGAFIIAWHGAGPLSIDQNKPE